MDALHAYRCQRTPLQEMEDGCGPLPGLGRLIGMDRGTTEPDGGGSRT